MFKPSFPKRKGYRIIFFDSGFNECFATPMRKNYAKLIISTHKKTCIRAECRFCGNFFEIHSGYYQLLKRKPTV